MMKRWPKVRPVPMRYCPSQCLFGLQHARVYRTVLIQNGLQPRGSQARTIGIVFSVIGALPLGVRSWVGIQSLKPSLVMMIILTVASLYIWRLGGQPKHYDRFKFRTWRWRSRHHSVPCCISAFSPTALAIIGHRFFGRGNNRVGAWFICYGAIVLSECLFLGLYSASSQMSVYLQPTISASLIHDCHGACCPVRYSTSGGRSQRYI